jgi:hypothetical protein
MHTTFRSLRLLAGGCALLAGLGLLGCSTSSTTTETESAVALTTTVNDPVEATSTDLSTAAITPADPAAGVLTMTAPTLSPSDGAGLASMGTEAALRVDPGNTGTAAGSLPLSTQADGTLRGSRATAVLPEGDSAIALSPDTQLDLLDQPVLSRARATRLRIASLNVLFSVHRKPLRWTMPTMYRLDLTRRQNMCVLKDSYLTLYWRGAHFVAPADGTAMMTVDLYNGATKVAGPLTKRVTVIDGKATFTGANHVPFNRVAITLDLRDAK